MKKEDLLSDEFLKQFKTGGDLYGFLAQLQKRGIEKMLEGELDAHLGYDKHEKTSKTNARNGFSNKKIKTSFGESEIQVPGSYCSFSFFICSLFFCLFLCICNGGFLFFYNFFSFSFCFCSLLFCRYFLCVKTCLENK